MKTAEASLAKNHKPQIKMSEITKLEQKVLDGGRITQSEALLLSEAIDKEALYAAAGRIREYFLGKKIDLCAIVNARSGQCTENCKWCAQSSHYPTSVDTYEIINSEEALQQARTCEKAGVKKFSLVTSGRSIQNNPLSSLCALYQKIGRETNLEFCASMGLLSREKLRKLKQAGVTRYHCNLETAPSYFSDLCTTHTIEEKMETLKTAREEGMSLCSGGIIGMGETMAQRIELAFTLRDLAVDSIPLNILNPISGTPLENEARLSDEEILKTIAIFRFIHPKSHLRFAGGRTLILGIQDKALSAGISAALVGDLLTTVGVGLKEDIAHFKALGYEC